MRLWFRRLHLVIAWFFVGAVVIQVFLAGRAVFLGSRYWQDHFAFAVTGVALTALLVLVSAVAARLPRSAVGWAALPLFGFVGVELLAFLRFQVSTRELAALHPVGALVLFGVGILVARRARRYVQEPAVAPPPAAPVAAARSGPMIDRRLVVIGVIVAVVAIAYLGSQAGDGGGGGGGGGGGDSYMSEYGGNPAVYQRIAGETDCDALQAEFDQAAANHDRDTAAGDLEAMRWSTGYMTAADDRMRAIG